MKNSLHVLKNLIEQRKRLREKFSKEINIQPEKLTSNAVDGEFIQRVLSAAEKNLGNAEFDTEHLAQELFVSRRQLHRKLQAITGQGPGEFIRVFKLKKAAQMLIENKLNVTQIAYEVGFESPAQFTRAFQKTFQLSSIRFQSKHPASNRHFRKLNILERTGTKQRQQVACYW